MINPIEFSGMIQRTQDVSIIKQNEDVKPQFEHMSVKQRSEQEAIDKHEHVTKQDNADKKKNKYDAKEKGNNEYYGNGRKNKKKEEEEGTVIKRGSSSFDVQV